MNGVVSDYAESVEGALHVGIETFPKIERVVDTIHFVTSSTNPLVQGADLVAFLTRRRATHTEKDARAAKANEDLWNIIQPQIYHHWCWHP